MQESKQIPFSEWAIKQHRGTNHKYDTTLPYEFHLKLVVKEVNRHWVAAFGEQSVKSTYQGVSLSQMVDAAWGHDLIEDTRANYNDILIASGNDKVVAELIFACTNSTGRNRTERADGFYYLKIQHTPGATFLKLCDRIANVRYGLFMGSSYQTAMYKKEQPEFIKSLTRHCPPAQNNTLGAFETLQRLIDTGKLD